MLRRDVLTNGIDVSQYQGLINWEVVKNHIDFAIIRCGYGQDIIGQDDELFKRNADECTRLNIPFGVYLYSYAKNVEDARGEARHVMRLVKDYKMAYPIYYDLEDENTTGRQSNEVIANIAKAFADELEANGYFVGMYASLYWWKTKLTSEIFDKYTRWVANYAAELNFDKDYDMWQYSSTGWVEGISTIVDLNYCYKDFPKIISEAGKNNFNKNISVERYKVGDNVIKAGQKLTGLSFEEQKKFHIKVWIFTHGIACLVATATIKISDEEISELLRSTVLEMLKGLKMGGNSNE